MASRWHSSRGSALPSAPHPMAGRGGLAWALVLLCCSSLLSCGESDKTSPAPKVVAEIAEGSQSSNPVHLVSSGEVLYFAADDGLHGVELWRSDGTERGTSLVADIASGPAGSYPRDLTLLGERLFFVADDGVRGSELFVSDGTAAGTRIVLDLFPGSRSSEPTLLTAAQGLCFFSANHPTAGIEPWRSDGTASGTYLLADVNPGAASSFPRSFTTGLGAAWFATLSTLPSGDGSFDTWLVARIHQTNGTTSGTRVAYENRVRQPSWAGAWDWIDLVRAVGSRVTFFEQNALFALEGTDAPAEKVWVFPGAGDAHSQMPGVGLPVVSASMLHVPGRQSYAGQFTLFDSDGTTVGTRAVGGDLGMDFTRLSVVTAGEKTYLRAGTGPELWVSAGGRAPSRLSEVVPDFGTGRGFFSPSNDAYDATRYADVLGRLVFNGDDGKVGRELWESDGTAAGTRLSADIAEGPSSSDPAELVLLGSRVCFSAWETTHGRELFCQDRR